jgi:hypothetical protein
MRLEHSIPPPPSEFSSQIVKRLQSHFASVGSRCAPVSELSKLLDDEVSEQICEQYGGLASFLRIDEHASRFFSLAVRDGVLRAHCHKHLDSAAAVGVVPATTSTVSKPKSKALDRDDVVEYCDVFRLARFLSCDHFTPLAEIPVSELLQKPVADVIAMQPDRFECEMDINTSFGSSHVKAVKYILPRELLEWVKMPAVFSELSVQELLEKKASIKNAPLLKQAKMRRKITRALLRKRFPNGTPFLDPPVTAMLLFDAMPETPVLYNCIGQLLPNGGYDGCPFNRAFFLRFPSLFAVTEGEVQTIFSVTRRDIAGFHPVTRTKLSKDEALLEVIAKIVSLRKNKTVAILHKSFLLSCVSRAALEVMNEVGLDKMLCEQPAVFSGSASKSEGDAALVHVGVPIEGSEFVRVDIPRAIEAMNTLASCVSSRTTRN